MRSSFLIILAAVAGCGGNHPATDAAVPDATPDAVALDCDSYCNAIQLNCTGANAQYGGTDSAAALQSCKQTCASFAPGTSVNETSGNTLGCRIHYALDASNPALAPADCIHAGPAGDVLTASSMEFCGDPCTSFCAVEIKACGSVQMPLPGNPRDATNNALFQYQNMANCVSACAGLDKTHPYSPAAMGDSLACRLYQATQAVISVMPDGVLYCADTASFPPTGRCAGTATP